MYNQINYNEKDYNVLGLALGASNQDSIVFNGYSLQNADIITQLLIQDNTPDRSIDTFDIPRGHGQVLTGDYWRRKLVRVSGHIKKTTGAYLEEEIDKMKKALAVPESDLDIKINGVIRRYIATLTNGQSIFNERKGYHVNACPFAAEFISLEPFGHAVSYLSRTLFGETSLDLDEQIENTGTVQAKPVIILNFTAASGVSAVLFSNNTTGEQIKLTQSISAGDYVKFDSETMEVTINGVAFDYDGSFPTLSTGVNSITVTVTGTSATYDLTMKFKPPFL